MISRPKAQGSQTEAVRTRSYACQTDHKMQDIDIIPFKEALKHQITEQKLQNQAEKSKKEAIRY